MTEIENYIPEQDVEHYVTHDGSMVDDDEQSAILVRLNDVNPATNIDYPRTQLGMATLIEDVLDGKAKYCINYKSWYLWDGVRWKPGIADDNSVISKHIQLIFRCLDFYCKDQMAYAYDILDSEKSQAQVKLWTDYRKYAQSLQRAGEIRGIINLLADSLSTMVTEFDDNVNALNTPTLAFTLNNFKDIKNRMESKISKVTASAPLKPYDMETCTRWYKFIDEICSGDKEKALFLQRALGYSLLGDNREECMFLIYGPDTRNGKGTLFTGIRAALGEDYYGAASPEIICDMGKDIQDDPNAPKPALAYLVGKRFCELSEPSKNQRISVAVVKRYTGKDAIATRALYGKTFVFRPQFTMWLQSNFLPIVSDDTLFSSNRIHVITFLESFKGNKLDRNLKEVFTDPKNTPTILSWLLEGCQMYLKEGLNPPKCVVEATESYRNRYDHVKSFIEDKCTVSPELSVQRGTLYNAYKTWCRNPEQGYYEGSNRNFFDDLSRKGYKVERVGADGYHVIGLELK